MIGVENGNAAAVPRRAAGRSDRAIRITTVVAVATVAAVAAFVSYRHMRGVALLHGEDTVTATVLPFSVDGLIVAASMAMLADRRAGRRRSWLSATLLAAGACASLAANVLHADPTATARIIAGWPPLALLGSYELLMRQIHPARRSSAATAATVTDAGTVEDAEALADAGVGAAATESVPATTTAVVPVTAQAAPATPPADSADIPTGPAAAAPAGAAAAHAQSTAGPPATRTEADRLTAAASPAAEPVEPVEPVEPARPAAPAASADTPAHVGGPRRLTPVPFNGLDTTDPSVKRAAIIRALDETGGSATAAVSLLGRWGVTVSKSWVYQVRKETRYANLQTGPLPVPAPRAPRGGSTGRRRGMAAAPSLTVPSR
ncbi:hypothetical protein CC117_12275 [Parafrankia colletiae]|uniref:DUF2637 domain-containing protein n=1 Tax=Parafrankia colletiae TaxID=573497 RepID=A0A1S1R5T7_9ACTN|nr:hypothetical protein CC117_12275 [Parafrankia colletiae]